MRVEWTDVRRRPIIYILLEDIDGEREQANWDMAAILELQSVPFSFRNKTGRVAYCKKIIESMCVKLR